MKLKTERLDLIPLDPRQLGLWAGSLTELERELDFRYDGEPLEGAFLELVKGRLARVRADPGSYLFHSFWLIVLKSERLAIGAADFKAPPNLQGEVELGYGLGRRYERNGYMAEAAAALCRWALGRPEVSAVIARTDRESFSAHRTLENCGMRRYRETPDSFWWRTGGRP